MKFSYYPGCSLHGSSKEYDVSTQAVCRALGIDLKELPDWICCGASSGHSINEVLNIGLPAHNLKIAEGIGLDLAVPCAACYNRLVTAQHVLQEEENRLCQMQDLLDHDFQLNINILNLIELVKDRVGLDTVRSKVVNPLTDLRVACYYGCLLVRPAEITQFDNPEHPQSMDEIMEAVGAHPVAWSFKAECCGGSLSLTRDDIVCGMVDEIVDIAREADAQCIVTACPLCFENLEMRQTEKRMVTFYFTELLGVAFGIKESKRWMKKHLINPNPLLKSMELQYE